MPGERLRARFHVLLATAVWCSRVWLLRRNSEKGFLEICICNHPPSETVEAAHLLFFGEFWLIHPDDGTLVGMSELAPLADG